jgi:DNA repair protein RadA/Sms
MKKNKLFSLSFSDISVIIYIIYYTFVNICVICGQVLFISHFSFCGIAILMGQFTLFIFLYLCTLCASLWLIKYFLFFNMFYGKVSYYSFFVLLYLISYINRNKNDLPIMSQKLKVHYICQQCGYKSAKWLGKCPECESWDSFQEEVPVKIKPLRRVSKAEPLLDNADRSVSRLKTNMAELDRTLGGGIVPGAVILIGGDPGIGKSTLMIQVLDAVQGEGSLLYISGEESINQVYDRARRLDVNKKNILYSNETNLENILSLFKDTKPQLIVIDSIQTLYSEEIDSIPGNVSQLRLCTAELLKYAKNDNVPVFLIGHVTKDGAIAGPKVLEHMVDTVIYFEGDNKYDYRILRSVKNRFGPVNEIGLFQMTGRGLIAIKNPSEIFLMDSEQQKSGDAVVTIMEGNRPFLVQVQALVTRTQFGMPQRTATGIDHRRMNLLLAVLEKRCARPFGFHDVFLKTGGGLRIDEPATDLGICMALISSIDDKPLPAGTVYIGEVGLGGEIRAVSRLEDRIKEAQKFGLKSIIIPGNSKFNINVKEMNLIKIKKIQDLI